MFWSNLAKSSCKNVLRRGKHNVCHGITVAHGYGNSKLQLTLNSE